jgi:hypothetical protein
MADRAPDLSVIGGLYDPTKPRDQQKPVVPPQRHASVESNGLFVSADDYAAKGGPSTETQFVPPPYQTQTKNKTCFFWDHSLKLRGKAFCAQGNSCSYDHFFGSDKPVAAPPADWLDEEIGQTCFFGSIITVQRESLIVKKVMRVLTITLSSLGSLSHLLHRGSKVKITIHLQNDRDNQIRIQTNLRFKRAQPLQSHRLVRAMTPRTAQTLFVIVG